MCDKYSEIIDKPYEKSARHPQMSSQSRAAQFAPFAALSGHDKAMKEAELANEEKMNNPYR